MAGGSSIFLDLFSLIYGKLPYLMKKFEVNFEKVFSFYSWKYHWYLCGVPNVMEPVAHECFCLFPFSLTSFRWFCFCQVFIIVFHFSVMAFYETVLKELLIYWRLWLVGKKLYQWSRKYTAFFELLCGHTSYYISSIVEMKSVSGQTAFWLTTHSQRVTQPEKLCVSLCVYMSALAYFCGSICSCARVSVSYASESTSAHKHVRFYCQLQNPSMGITATGNHPSY